MKKLYLFLSLSVLLMACSEEDESRYGAVPEIAKKLSFAYEIDAEETHSLQKTTIDRNGLPNVFQKGDKIAINGKDNIFEDVLNDDGIHSFNFFGKMPEAHDYYALYPASAATQDEFSSAIMTNIPSVQYIGKDKPFDPEAHILVGHSTSTDTTLSFKTACSFLKFTITKPCGKIVFEPTTDTDEPCGGYTIDFSDYNEPQILDYVNSSHTITLLPSDNEVIPAGTYFISIRPGYVCTSGFKMKFYKTPNSTSVYDTFEYSKSANNRVFANKKVLNIGEVDFSFKSDLVKFTTQPKSQEVSIYASYSVKSTCQVGQDGQLVMKWYKKVLNGSDWVETKSKVFDFVKKGSKYSFNLYPKSNYINTLYRCDAILLNNDDTICISSSYEAMVNQIIDDNSVPLVSIQTENFETITREGYLSASFDLDAFGLDKNLSFDNLKIKGRGNSSWNASPKKSYTLKFSDKTAVLGMPKSKKWVLISNYFDKTLLRNYYVSHLGNEILKMDWNPHFKPVNLVLNNEFLGTYLLGESVKIESNRINIQSAADAASGKSSLVDLNGDGGVDINDGGFVLEINARLDENFNFTTKHGIKISLKDPDTDDFVSGATTLDDEVANYITGTIQKAEDVLYSSQYCEEDNGYIKYFDTKSFIDWWIVNEFTKNTDAAYYTSVYIYYNPKDGLIHMGPNWDFDISCGNIDYNDCDNPEGFRIYGKGWHRRLFTDPAFVEKVKARWNEVKSDIYVSVNYRIQEMANELEQTASLNFARWSSVLGKKIFHSAAGYEERTTYQSEIDYMVDWLNARYVWMDGAINSL